MRCVNRNLRSGLARDVTDGDTAREYNSTEAPMTARIYQPPKSSMTSGMGKSKIWLLDFVHDGPKPVDPLMGWTGSTDTSQQVRLSFPSKEAAMDYAARHGIAATLEEPRKRKHRPRGYGDNFSTARRIPWSH